MLRSESPYVEGHIQDETITWKGVVSRRPPSVTAGTPVTASTLSIQLLFGAIGDIECRAYVIQHSIVAA